jgi:hypothetical protein
MYLDGRGLYLQVVAAPTADEPHRVTKSWIFRYALNGRPRKMGLGSVHDLTLAQARAKAADARKQAKDGIDPIDDRHVKVVAKAAEEAKAAARAITFDQCADAYIASHEAGWRNAKHRQQMEEHPRDVCVAGLRQAGGRRGRHCDGAESDRAYLAKKPETAPGQVLEFPSHGNKRRSAVARQ